MSEKLSTAYEILSWAKEYWSKRDPELLGHVAQPWLDDALELLREPSTEDREQSTTPTKDSTCKPKEQLNQDGLVG